MTTDLFFRKARQIFRPLPVPVAVPTVRPAIPAQPLPAWIPPTEIPLGPKRPDVETIGTSFAFGMQQVTVALHATSDAPARFPSSLVGGR